jgi:SAM-dependent methyltransferase
MMSAGERARSTQAESVIWHDLECGGYEGDLETWRELAGSADGAILDLGCGTGRVALDLAGQGHPTQGLDIEPELVAAFNARAEGARLPASAVAGDAREFDLEDRFAAILAPMQLIQLFDSPSERVSCLRCAARHLQPGGTIAVAIVDGFPVELVEDAPPPLPDTREMDGWVYSSLPLDAALETGTIVVRRRRQAVSPDGELSDELDEIPLRLLRAETVESEAREAGLEPSGHRRIEPTDAHIGSTVILMERSG